MYRINFWSTDKIVCLHSMEACKTDEILRRRIATTYQDRQRRFPRGHAHPPVYARAIIVNGLQVYFILV